MSNFNVILILGDNMKLLFFSDIHGINDNLKNIKDLDKKEKFDKIFILGDLFNNYNSRSNIVEISKFLNSFKDRIVGVLGNCDSKSDILLCDFPIEKDYLYHNIDDIDMYITHGNKYNRETGFNREGVLIYGHFHYPHIERDNGIIYICVGSISLPRFNSKPSYLIYNDRKFTLYDINKNIIDSVKL